MFPAAELPRLPGRAARAARRPLRSAARPPDAEGEAASAARCRGADLDPRQTRLLVIARRRRGAAGRDRARGRRRVRRRRRGEPRRPTADDDDRDRRPTERGDPAGRAASHRRRRRDRRGGLRPRDRRPAVRRLLDPTGSTPRPQDQTYVVWLMLTETEGYPLSPIAVSRERQPIENRFPIPAAVLPLVARVRCVDVSIAPVERRSAELVRDAIAGQRPGPREARRDRPARRDPAAGARRDGPRRSRLERQLVRAAACPGS